MEINIAHVASHSINVGDGAIVNGIQGTIRKLYPGLSFKFHNLEIVDYVNNNKNWEASVFDFANYDAILVGGGGTIDGAADRGISGFAFRMDPTELRKLKTPICFVGIGHNVFPGRRIRHPKKLSEFIEVCAERDIPFSLREDLSRERLSQIINTDHVTTIPDPGFFLTVDSSYQSPAINPSRKTAILQFATDNLDRFGGKESAAETIMDLVTLFKSTILALVNFDFDVILAPHTMTDYVGGFAIFREMQNDLMRRYVRILELAHPSNAAQFFNNYTKADFVFGTRGHSVICATALGAPTLALSTHPKIGGYMKEMGLSEWSVSYPQENIHVTIERIANQLINNPKPQRDIVLQKRNEPGGMRERYHSFLQGFFDKIV